MSTFRQADAEDIELMDAIIEEHHSDLKNAGVRIGLLFAHTKRDDKTGEPKGPAITHGGYPALGLCKINSHKDRVSGLPDATITLDGDQWPDMEEEQRVSLLDHELYHLQLDLDRDGAVKLDDCHRPKLKMRLHDLVIGGFEEVVKRHGKNTHEFAAFADIHRKLVQRELVFPG